MAGDVAPGAADGGRIEVDGIHLGVLHGRGERGGDGTRAAAKVDDNGPEAGQWARGLREDGVLVEKENSLLDEELGAAARHEDARIDSDAQPAELGPAEDLLQRQARRPLLHHGVELIRGSGPGDEQPGLVFGEDAARGPEPGHDQGLIHAAGAGSEGS